MNANATKTILGQPRSVILLSGVEFWERAAFFGMMGLFIHFLTSPVAGGGLAWDFGAAVNLFGLFFSAMWVFPIIGGWIADRFTGMQTAVVWGALLMMIGYFGLVGVQQSKGDGLYVMLGLIVIGNALFKPAIISLVGRFYRADDPRRESGYTILYLCINIGNFAGNILIGGLLGEKLGWQYGFAAAGIGMLLGLLLLAVLRKRMLGQTGNRPAPGDESRQESRRLTGAERERFKAIAVLMFLFMLFIAAYGQLGGLVNHFVMNDVARSAQGFVIPATWFLSLNALFIIIAGPVFASYWTRLEKRGKNPGAMVKYSFGMLLVSAGFLVLALGAVDREVAAEQNVALWWVVLFYFLFTLGELMIFPIFLALVTRLAPDRYNALATGLLFGAAGLGFYISGKIGALSESYDTASTFLALALMAFLSTFISLLIRKRFLLWSK